MATITTPAGLPPAMVGTFYSQPLTVLGVTPFTWSLIAAPAWLSIDTVTGTLSGTPPTAGTFAFNVTVLDSATPPTTDTRAFALVVNAAAPPPPPPPPFGGGPGGRDVLRKLAASAAGIELMADGLAFFAAVLPFALSVKYPILSFSLVTSLVADFVLIGYLVWRQPVPPPGRPTARDLRGGMFAATIAAILTVGALLLVWVPMGIPGLWLTLILAIVIFVLFVQDIVAAIAAIR